MSKKKINRNTNLEHLNKINLLNKKINKLRKTIIRLLHDDIMEIKNTSIAYNYEKLLKAEQQRNVLNNKLKK